MAFLAPIFHCLFSGRTQTVIVYDQSSRPVVTHLCKWCLPPHFYFLLCACVCGVQGIQYYKIIWLYDYNFWGFNTHIFLYLLKYSVPTLVRYRTIEISYYCYYFLTATLPTYKDRVPHVDNIIKHHFCPCLGCCNVDTIINHQFGHCPGCKM